MLKIEKYYHDLSWLEEVRQRFSGLVRTGRCPHALLIHGRHGTGRRQLALSIAESVLGQWPARDIAGEEGGEAGHPDFVELIPLVDPKTGKERRTIGVDQVRELIGFLALTSHGVAGRVAVVYPAEAMTPAAANSLLKTLEEPPDNTLIIIITESLRRLPATVISRCQRVRIPPPSGAVALAWLEARGSSPHWPALLDFAAGAPLAALALHESGFAEIADGYATDLAGLERRQCSPVEVAERWKPDPDLALRWLHWRLANRVRKALEALSAGELQDARQTERARLAVAASFRQMGQIRELRRLITGGINAELNLAGLLTDWYGGLGQN